MNVLEGTEEKIICCTYKYTQLRLLLKIKLVAKPTHPNKNIKSEKTLFDGLQHKLIYVNKQNESLY